MYIWPNQLVFNIYGDPSVGLKQTVSGALAGTVLTLGGDPIPGALVESADGSVWTRTRGDGSYLLRGFGQGVRDILVSSPGFYPQRFYDVSVQPGAATHLDVRLAEAANGTVTGHVYDIYGSPVQDAVVAVGDSGFEATTLSDGSFEIAGLPPGSYTVMASKFPFAQEMVADCRGWRGLLHRTRHSAALQDRQRHCERKLRRRLRERTGPQLEFLLAPGATRGRRR